MCKIFKYIQSKDRKQGNEFKFCERKKERSEKVVASGEKTLRDKTPNRKKECQIRIVRYLRLNSAIMNRSLTVNLQIM